MTDQEFKLKNKGTRGGFVLFGFLLAVSVGVETESMSWFWITLMAVGLNRLAAVAALLDRIDNSPQPKRTADKRAAQ